MHLDCWVDAQDRLGSLDRNGVELCPSLEFKRSKSGLHPRFLLCVEVRIVNFDSVEGIIGARGVLRSSRSELVFEKHVNAEPFVRGEVLENVMLMLLFIHRRCKSSHRLLTGQNAC